MSLKVWLPLNRHLRNVGLDKVSIANYGTSLVLDDLFGNSHSFNGTSDYFQFNNLDIDSKRYLTLAFWCYSNNSNLQGLFTSRINAGSHAFSLTNTGLGFRDTQHDNWTTFSFEQPPTNAWTHYAIVYKDGTWLVYKNGVKISEQVYTSATMKTSINEIRVGRYQSSSGNVYFKGKLNDFRIYDNALDQDEINRLYTRKPKELLLWFPFTKDFKNSGLVNAKTTKLGTTTQIINDGPFGGSLSAGNGTQIVNGVQCETNLLDELSEQKFSCSIWVNPKGNHVHYNGTFFSSGNWNTKNWAFGTNSANTQVDMFGPRYNTYVSCTLPLNEWTHLVSTYNNKLAKLYKNGQYVTAYTFPDSYTFSSDTTVCAVGRETYAGGYFSFNGNIADLRVYSTILGDIDVKRLSEKEEIVIIPFEYEKLEYIQSNNSAWLDSGINPKIKPRAVVKMAMINTNDTDYWGNKAIDGSAYYADFSSYNLQYYRYGSTTSQNVNFRVGQNEIHVWDVSDKVYVDGVLKFTSTNTYTYNAAQSTIQIFKAARNTYYSTYKLYNFKLYDGDSLVRNFIPAKRKSDDVIGLFDIVSMQFFTNVGSGSFTGT